MAPMLVTLRREAEALSQGRHRITRRGQRRQCDLLRLDQGTAQRLLQPGQQRGALHARPAASIDDPFRPRRRRRRRAVGARHRLRHPGRSTCRASPNASTASPPAARANAAAPAWACPSSSTCWACTRRAWRSKAKSAGQHLRLRFGAERVRPRAPSRICMRRPHMTPIAHAHRHPPRHRSLRDPALYLNRELSQLEFNFRVLAQAQDPSRAAAGAAALPVHLLHQPRRILRDPRRHRAPRRWSSAAPLLPDGMAPADRAGAHPRPRRASWSRSSTAAGTTTCARR